MEETDSKDQDQQQTQVVSYNVTMAEIAVLAEKFKDVPEDLSEKKNYAIVKGAISAIKPLRGKVEKRRKELKADALAWGKKVDGEAKKITTSLLEIEAPHAKAKKDYDTRIEVEKREKALAEEKRVDGIAEKIAGIKALVESNISSTSSIIQEAIDRVAEDHTLSLEWAQEFEDKADLACIEVTAKLVELRDMKLQQENAEAERVKAEKEREEADEAARVKRETEVEEERAKLAKEREAMAKEKKEAAKEQAKKDEETEAERAKLAAEVEALKKEKEEPAPEPEPVQEKKPAKSSKKTAGYSDDYKAAGNSLLKFADGKAKAKALLDAIINGDIPNITFTGEV